ncbi:FAD/NAD(P)-binding protein [Streptomyces badius]
MFTFEVIAGSTCPSIAIIGMGSRGLGVLERLVSRCLADPFDVTVHIVDAQPPGAGFHRPDQPDYLLLNTVCSQLTAFSDASMVTGPASVPGPSLYEWCVERDLRLSDDGYTVSTGAGRPVRANDYLPRRLLSEYLSWAAQRILAAAPASLRLQWHSTTATSVRPDPAGERIALADGTSFTTDAVFVTIGHHTLYLPPEETPDAPYIRRPYPLPAAVDPVRAGERVVLLGMSLTAMDIVASLTLGRGGRHVIDDGRSRYEPSGREPEIILTCRTGLPARSRPRLNPGRVKAAPLALTSTRVKQLRDRRPHGRLNFTEDVLPLVETEIELTYYRTLLAQQTGDAESARREFAQRAAEEGTEALLTDSRERFGASPVRGFLSRRSEPRRWATYEDYADWFTEQVAEDLAEARAGLGNSPLKEALEVLRDHRDVLREVIDSPGLDDESTGYFFGEFASTVNRMVTGPQLDRSVELLALIRAGIVRLAPGAGPTLSRDGERGPWTLESTTLGTPTVLRADRVITGHLVEPGVEEAAGSLLADLVKSGRARTLAHRGTGLAGLDVTREGRPVDSEGTVQQRIFLLGPYTEGSSYYNHYIPSPHAPSRALMDADLALSAALPRGTDS